MSNFMTEHNIDRGGFNTKEVAKILGISSSQVKRIENIALRKLKISKKLYDYYKTEDGLPELDLDGAAKERQ